MNISPQFAEQTEPPPQYQVAERHYQAPSAINRWASEHPRAVIGSGLVLGVVLGWLLKRKM